MRPRDLPRHLPGIIQRGKLGHRGRCTRLQQGPEEADVDSIFLEALVDTSKILGTISYRSCTKSALVNHRQIARNVLHCRGSANWIAKCIVPKNSGCSALYPDVTHT